MIKKKTISTIIPVLLFVLFFQYSQALALTINEERKLGREFMAMINKHNKIIHDPMAQELVSEIGERLIANLDAQPFNFSFYIVDEEQFNAFAAPGANIFVNRGLVSSLDNVDELAGILGHEIAHAVCRHVAQMVEKSKLLNIGTLAGVLAGVLVGSAGGGGADVGQAVAIGSMAAGQTAMLSYSRENETEADQKGLIYIQEASFNPRGLLTGLEKIRARDWYGSESVPDYLKTHPGSKERIIYIQSWLDEHGTKNTIDNQINSLRFDMIKYRLAAIYGNSDETENLFNGKLEKTPDDPALNYAMGILMARKSLFEDALKYLRKALEKQIFDPYILMEMGRIYTIAGEAEKALEIMEGLESIPQVENQVTFFQAKANLMLKRTQQAKDGFETIIESCPATFPRAYYYMADIQEKLGKKALSHFYLGMYYHETKDIKNSVFHLEKSLENSLENPKKEKAEALLKSISKKKAK